MPRLRWPGLLSPPVWFSCGPEPATWRVGCRLRQLGAAGACLLQEEALRVTTPRHTALPIHPRGRHSRNRRSGAVSAQDREE